jgi:hypothetical protein
MGLYFKLWLENEYREVPSYGRGAAWITAEGIVYHCGLTSHATIFRQMYKGKAIDIKTIKDYTEDIWKVVKATDWIRVLSGNFMVKTINRITLKRIQDFLLMFPNYVQEWMSVDDERGNSVNFRENEIENLPELAAFGRLGKRAI